MPKGCVTVNNFELSPLSALMGLNVELLIWDDNMKCQRM